MREARDVAKARLGDAVVAYHSANTESWDAERAYERSLRRFARCVERLGVIPMALKGIWRKNAE